MKKVFKIIGLVILLALLSLNIFIIAQSKINPDKVPSVFGYKPFIVLSGSMETNISVGDLVFVKEVDPKTLKLKDVIAFHDSEKLVTTHRIVEFIEQGDNVCYKTKGDANNAKDKGIVCADDVEGKYAFKIVGLGNIILFIQQPLGFIIMMLIILIIGILMFTVGKNKLDKEELKEFEEYKKNKQKKD